MTTVQITMPAKLVSVFEGEADVRGSWGGQLTEGRLPDKSAVMVSDLQRAVLIARNTTHGLSRVHKSTYRSWKDARARCRNPNNSDYARYGGRGITFALEWDSFAEFFAALGPRPKGMTLERVDRDKGYEPGNCMWADRFVQANNRSNNVPITWNGVTKNLMQWCRETGVDRTKARYRIRQGWPLEDCFNPTTDFRV